jgi:hypothetical protein
VPCAADTIRDCPRARSGLRGLVILTGEFVTVLPSPVAAFLALTFADVSFVIAFVRLVTAASTDDTILRNLVMFFEKIESLKIPGFPIGWRVSSESHTKDVAALQRLPLAFPGACHRRRTVGRCVFRAHDSPRQVRLGFRGVRNSPRTGRHRPRAAHDIHRETRRGGAMPTTLLRVRASNLKRVHVISDAPPICTPQHAFFRFTSSFK